PLPLYSLFFVFCTLCVSLLSTLFPYTTLFQAVWSAISALGIEAIVMSGPAVQAAPVLVGQTMDRLLSGRARNLGMEISVSVSQVQPHPCGVGAAVLALQTFMTPGRASRSGAAGADAGVDTARAFPPP